MRSNFSPARKVRSTTEPLARFFSFVRTNAPPLPGLTCWKPTIRQTSPSTLTCMPFLNWFVLTASATDRNLVDADQVLGERGEHLGLAVTHDDEVLDPDSAQSGKVDAGLDGDDHPLRERVLRLA